MLILIDGHVHIHDCFDIDCFFTSAFENFRIHAKGQGREDSFISVLCLTESIYDNWFSRLKSCAQNKAEHPSRKIYEWKVATTGDPLSLELKGGKGELVYILAGRQIVTSERLEVLALGTDSRYIDGESLITTVESVLRDDAIPVIPWGFGKWYGKRGDILKKLIESHDEHTIFLGDNGGRSSILPYPSHFRLAEARGIRILPGSDPLPFPHESKKPGSYGFAVFGTIDCARPVSDLKRIILDPAVRLVPYGKPETLSRFIRNQCAMQMLMRNSKKDLDSQ